MLDTFVSYVIQLVSAMAGSNYFALEFFFKSNVYKFTCVDIMQRLYLPI